MLKGSRTKAEVLLAVKSCSAVELAHLNSQALTEPAYWGSSNLYDKKIIAKFKSEVKAYYFFQQSRRCCYCSIEFAKAQNTYDAEHIIDKGRHPQFMFDTKNLAVACKPCNKTKDQSWVLTASATPVTVPDKSEDYSIVHPHVDEWEDHLSFDNFGRIIPVDDTKGAETLRVCGIYKLNAARLADYFVGHSQTAEKFFVQFFEESSVDKKSLKLKLLRDLSSRYDLPGATAILDALENEFNRLMGGVTDP